jgi:hypothetical protein
MTPIEAVVAEAAKAQERFGDFTSTHEALGVLSEEFDELKEAIHANRFGSIMRESKQVSAVALRLLDICQRATAGAADAFKSRSGA